MRRLLTACIFCFSCRELPARTSNPQDIDLQVRPTKETRAYHIGEPIELERVYSTSSEKKYGLNTSSQPSIEFSFSPSQGVVDLEALRWENGWAGSIIGGFGILGSQPQVLPLQLTAYYRIERPGHYSVAVVSREVTRIKTAEEGG